MSQTELANKIGVTNKAISKWENGSCLPDISLFKPLCNSLDITVNELLNGEKEVTGMYISGHPLYEYSSALSEKGLKKTFDLNDTEKNVKLDGKFVSIVAMVSKLRRKSTKSNETMAFLEVEDMYGTVNVLVFPKLYAEYQHLFGVGTVLKITGRVSVKETGDCDVVCHKIETVSKGTTANSGSENVAQNDENKVKNIKKGLYLRVGSMQSDEYKQARLIMDKFVGSTPVIVKALDTGKAYILPETQRVSINNSMLSDLTKLLGDENVKNVN